MAADFRNWVVRQRAPFTLFLAASLAASALYWWLTRMQGLDPYLLGSGFLERPWTVVTYPWAYMPFGNFLGITCYLFLLFWLFTTAPQLERDMGTGRFAAFWFASTVVAGLLVAFGMRGLGIDPRFDFGGPWLPASAVTVLWCARNQTATIMLYGMVPISGFWLAVFTAVADVLYFGTIHPVVGLLAGLHLIPAWFFGLGRMPIGFTGKPKRKKEDAVVKGGTRYDDAYYENVKKREIEREEQERLRKLFEGK